jgi:hypothetical protein
VGQADQEPVGSARFGHGHAERGPQRLPLWLRQHVHLGQERDQQLVERGEADLRLRLDGRETGHLHPAGLGDSVVEQRRLADSRLAAQHQRPTETIRSGL